MSHAMFKADEQPDRNRGLSAAELMQKREEAAHEAEHAAQEAALHVVECWNAERGANAAKELRFGPTTQHCRAARHRKCSRAARTANRRDSQCHIA